MDLTVIPLQSFRFTETNDEEKREMEEAVRIVLYSHAPQHLYFSARPAVCVIPSFPGLQRDLPLNEGTDLSRPRGGLSRRSFEVGKGV